MRKRRGPPKDRKTKIPKKYLSGTKGRRRSELARAIKKIAKLYKEGKTVPRSLIKRRVALGKKKKKRARKKS
jgi:hypothetical protein|tara:strand:- start:210 stop:425 length:216 start_codon:yes stop_codon:yes gene_type:complete